MARGRMNRLTLLLTFVLVIQWSNVEVEAKKSRKNTNGILSGSEKLVQLQDHVIDGVVPFTNELFTLYAVRPERPYHLVLLVTTTAAKLHCDMCKKVAPEFELLAKSYKANEDNDVAVFFGIVDFDTNQEVFGRYDLTSAPHVLYLEPNNSIDTGDKIPKKSTIDPRNLYNIFSQGIKAESMALFVQEQTGYELKIERPKTTLYMLLIATLVVVVLLGKLILDHLDFVLAKLRRKQLWMTVSLLFYGLSVSGMVFCIIRNPPPFSVDRKGNFQYFHPQGRQQFVYEGLIIGGLNIAAAVFMILLSKWAIYVRNPIVRYLAIVCCALGFVFMYRQMTDAYKFKNSWYTGFMGF
ncbi:unnamed protein product [Peronospora destructor]|uniref:Uncharacterized protein n=1 Tax=Peronospora destructor TaxID=86335 RepID=A0AAV0SWM0_9STRA|nr:unnamed protein product [Peronospora destructor]